MSLKMHLNAPRVVQLADYKKSRLLLEDFKNDRESLSGHERKAGVVVLSDRVGSFASVEVDELSALTPKDQRDAVMGLVKEHLAMEFGHLRIVQNNRTFTIKHRNLEELIGALLRVQYHVYQCSVEDLEAVGVPCSFVSMNLTWGVGKTLADASDERLKRRRRKRFSQDT